MTDINKLTPQEKLELYLKRKKKLQQKASNEGWIGTEEYDKREQKLFEEIIHKGKKK